RVDAQRQVLCGGNERAPPQLLRILRERDRVQVDDAEVGVELILQTPPLADRPQGVDQVQRIRRGPDAGEDDATGSTHDESILSRVSQWFSGCSAPGLGPSPCARIPTAG